MLPNEKMILIDAIKNSGHKPEAYSGRGMYGVHCLGFRSSSTEKSILSIMFNLVEKLQCCEITDDEFHNVVDIMRDNITTDNMGLDWVIYWPVIKISESEIENKKII